MPVKYKRSEYYSQIDTIDKATIPKQRKFSHGTLTKIDYTLAYETNLKQLNTKKIDFLTTK